MRVRAVYRPVNPFGERFHRAWTEWKKVPDDADLSMLEAFARGAGPTGYIFVELEVEKKDDVKTYGDKFRKAGDPLQE